MNTKKLLSLVLTVLLGSIAVFWLRNSPHFSISHSAPQTHHKVVINEAARTLLYLPLYHAIEQGYFKESGIDVEIVTGGTATASFAAMISSEADFSQADPMYVPIAREKGGKVKVVAQIVGRIAVWAVTKNPSLNDVSAGTLRGRRIVTHPKPMTAFVYTERMLRNVGLDPDKDVSLIQAKPGTELAAFTSENADLLVAAEPTTSIAVAGGAHVVHSFPLELGDQVFSGVMTREDYINKNRAVVKTVLAAYQHALSDIHARPSAVVDTAKKYFPQLSENVLALSIQRLIADGVFPTTIQIPERSWNKAIAVRITAGDLKNTAPLSDNFEVF